MTTAVHDDACGNLIQIPRRCSTSGQPHSRLATLRRSEANIPLPASGEKSSRGVKKLTDTSTGMASDGHRLWQFTRVRRGWRILSKRGDEGGDRFEQVSDDRDHLRL